MHERRRARSEGERLRRRSRGEQSRGEQRGDGNGDGDWDGDSDGDGNGGTASNSKTEDAHAQAVGAAAAETAETAVSTETVDAKAANTEDPTAASAEDSTASQMVAPTAASARVPFERAFYINADGSALRRAFMQQQLNASGVRYERWPALLGGPRLLRTHARYFKRGVEKHLYVNHTKGNELVGWGTIGTYLSHLLLFKHILQRWKHDDSLAFLILQDDTQLRPRWLERTRAALRRIGPKWQRVLLVWWGLQRESACGEHFCRVRPPAGPTEAGPDCCGKRYFHGLQAWLVRVRSLRCLVRRLKRHQIKNIDALMVNCDCPDTYALRHRHMIGEHLDRELGSERAAVNSVWRSNLDNTSTLKRHALRNMGKVQITPGQLQ